MHFSHINTWDGDMFLLVYDFLFFFSSYVPTKKKEII